ncbi:MAG: thioredoxin family protein [Cyclobacteriaceae bacterium]
MSLTYSAMLPLNAAAPHFKLHDVITDQVISPELIKGEHGLLMMFVCNHCPYVKHIENEIGKLAGEYLSRGIGMVAITSNDIEKYPDDGPEGMKDQAKRASWNFPYLLDETQEVAKAYKAECTPDFFLFDKSLKCVYRGRMDSSSPGNGQPNDGADLRQALDLLIAGQPIPEDQKPSMGCNIKWRS